MIIAPTFGVAGNFLSKEKRADLPAEVINEISKVTGFVRTLDIVNKILGYIPIVGIGVGVTRVWIQLFEPTSKSMDTNALVRGIIEILGLGLLLLIPDILITAERHWVAK